ncbi:MAG: fibronectin type III domain-containing protein [Firmicutes bacterium]|nr:fibronectin type III domain-containing protein [Bacillota bacterium]
MKDVIKRIAIMAFALAIVFAFLPDFGLSEAYAGENSLKGTYLASTLSDKYSGQNLICDGDLKIIMNQDLDLWSLESDYDIDIVSEGDVTYTLKLSGKDARIQGNKIYVQNTILSVDQIDENGSDTDKYAIEADDEFIVDDSMIVIVAKNGIKANGVFNLVSSYCSVYSYYPDGEGILIDKEPLYIDVSALQITMSGENSYGIRSTEGDINFISSYDCVIRTESENSFPIYGKGNVVFSKSDVELIGNKAACVAPTAGLIIKKNNYIKVPTKGDVVKYNINFDTIGDPNGKIAKKVTISKKYLSDKACTVYAPNKVYTGDRIRPIVVRWNGNKITKDKSYKVSYSNNLNVGKAKVTIKGIGNFTGKVVKYFKINPKGTTLLKPEPLSKAVRVKWKIQKARMSKTHITGYKIKVATNKSFTKNVKTVTVKGYSKVSRRIKNLKAKKKYYVKIRTYKVINSKYYYSKWSAYKTFTTKG